MLWTVLCHLHQCCLRAGWIGLPVVIHYLKKELPLLFILCEWHIVLLLQSNSSLSRVIHDWYGWCCHPEVLLRRIISPFFRVLRKEALHLLSVQLQNVKDDSSPLCEARSKASRAKWGISRVCAHLLLSELNMVRYKFSSFTLQQHTPLQRSSCGYALGRPVAGFRGGNHWKSLEKKQDRPTETDKLTDSCCLPQSCHWFVSLRH